MSWHPGLAPQHAVMKINQIFSNQLIHLLLLSTHAWSATHRYSFTDPGRYSREKAPLTVSLTIGWVFCSALVKKVLMCRAKESPFFFLFPPEWLVFSYAKLLLAWYPWWRDGSKPHSCSIFIMEEKRSSACNSDVERRKLSFFSLHYELKQSVYSTLHLAHIFLTLVLW